MICEVEELSPEIDCFIFKQPPLLHERDVAVHQSRPDQRVSSEAPARIDRLQLEGVDVPVTIRPAQNRIVGRARFQIWPFVQREVRRIQITRAVIAGYLNCEGRPAAYGRDVVQLPSFEQGAFHTVTVFGERQFVRPIECQIVLHMKSREAAIVRAIVKIGHVLDVITEVLRVDSTRVIDGS